MFASILVFGACAFAASEPLPAPRATIELVHGPRAYRFVVETVTTGGTRYAILFDIDNDCTELARDRAFSRFVQENWLVGKKGTFGIEVFGVRGKGEKVDPVKSLTVTARQHKERDIAKVSGDGDVKVELREGEVKPAAKPLPTGPDLGPESFVEFDFARMPCEKGPWQLNLTVETTLNKFTALADHAAPDGCPRDALCDSIADGLRDIGFKAKVVGKSKVRVYGGIFDGKFHPATRGVVESPELKREQLPKVTEPPKA